MGRADSRASAIFRHRTALSSYYRSPAPEDRYSRRVAFRPVVADLGSGAIEGQERAEADRRNLRRPAEGKGTRGFECPPILRSIPPRSLGCFATQPGAKRRPDLSATARYRTRQVQGNAAHGAALPDPPRT